MKVVTLNQKDFKLKCIELASKFETKPDLTIGILTGGGCVLNELKRERYFSTSKFNSVKLQRNNTFKYNPFVKSILRVLPYGILNSLRILESNRARKSIKLIDLKEISSIKVHLNSEEKISEIKHILIVDDAIDTGKTMFIVKNNLNKLYPEAEIKTAVISWTIESSIIKPDYYLYKNILVRFPWSKDYKGKDFEKNSFSS